MASAEIAPTGRRFESGTRRRDLPALTGVRWFAALVVFCSHVVNPQNPGNPDPAEPFRDAGVTAFLSKLGAPAALIGVSCFFILSGFVITWSAKPGERVTSFYRRRVVKVFPNHAVTWALAMLLFASAYTIHHGIPNLLFVDHYSSNPAYWGGANTPSWSLNAEMLFYVLFPLLLLPIRRIPENRLWQCAGGVVLLTALGCLVTLWAIPDTPPLPGEAVSLPQYWFVYFFPPMRLFEFVLGMLAARIVLSDRWPRIPLPVVGALLVTGYLLSLVVPAPYRVVLVMMVPLTVMVGTLAVTNLRGRRTFLGTGPMIWLGQISYAFYLTQAIVLFAVRPAVFGDAEYGPAGGILLILGLLATTVVCAWLLHTCVERPAMKYLSRPRRRTPPDTARASSPPENGPVAEDSSRRAA